MSEVTDRVSRAVLNEIFEKTGTMVCNLDVGRVAVAAMRGPSGDQLVKELEYWLRVIGDRLGADRRFSDTAKDLMALLSVEGGQ